LSKHNFDAVIFDLDGVVTDTAKVHASACKELFDTYLRLWESRAKEPFSPFDKESDYLTYIDGKPRYEGVRSFLESRGIVIPYGKPSDGSDQETICGLGNKKNKLFNEILQRDGVEILSTDIKRSVVVEDSIAGVEAGKTEKFGMVIGVDRRNHSSTLKETGADLVAKDLMEIA
jgi:beta-phosphoglucomutase-like phosphatase (HAD superfamily)